MGTEQNNLLISDGKMRYVLIDKDSIRINGNDYTGEILAYEVDGYKFLPVYTSIDMVFSLGEEIGAAFSDGYVPCLKIGSDITKEDLFKMAMAADVGLLLYDMTVDEVVGIDFRNANNVKLFDIPIDALVKITTAETLAAHRVQLKGGTVSVKRDVTPIIKDFIDHGGDIKAMALSFVDAAIEKESHTEDKTRPLYTLIRSLTGKKLIITDNMLVYQMRCLGEAIRYNDILYVVRQKDTLCCNLYTNYLEAAQWLQQGQIVDILYKDGVADFLAWFFRLWKPHVSTSTILVNNKVEILDIFFLHESLYLVMKNMYMWGMHISGRKTILDDWFKKIETEVEKNPELLTDLKMGYALFSKHINNKRYKKWTELHRADVIALINADKDKQQENAAKIRENVDEEFAKQTSNLRIYTPSGIKELLDEQVYGQEEAKKEASLILWKMMNGFKTNAIFIGPSGCGKTEIWRQLKKIYPQICVVDGSLVTGEGWTGGTKSYSFIEDMLKNHVNKTLIEHSIVVIDEFDKLCTTYSGDSRSAEATRAVLSNYLRMLDGDKVEIKVRNFSGKDFGTDHVEEIDTSHMAFVFLGAFTEIYERHKEAASKRSIGFTHRNDDVKKDDTVGADELIKFGVMPEIMGRIGRIVLLDDFSLEDYQAVATSKSKMSPAYRLSEDYNIKLTFSEELLNEAAKEAYERNLGIRYIREYLRRLVDKKLYEINSPQMPDELRIS